MHYRLDIERMRHAILPTLNFEAMHDATRHDGPIPPDVDAHDYLHVFKIMILSIVYTIKFS